MLNTLTSAGLFILGAVVDFLTLILLLRFFLQAFRASFANQLGAFVIQASNWLVKPLRRLLPGLFGLDLASLLPAIALQALLLSATFAARGVFAMAGGEVALTIAWLAVLATLRFCIYLLIGVMLLQAVLSWVNPYSPLSYPVQQLTAPFLNPIRRILPPIAGFDLSPMVVLLLAQVLLMFF